MSDPFDIAHHNNPTYKPPAPWDEWDSDAGCWGCRGCGGAAGYQIHALSCAHAAPRQLTKGRLDGLTLSRVVDNGHLAFVDVTVDTLPGVRLVVESAAAKELHYALGVVCDLPNERMSMADDERAEPSWARDVPIPDAPHGGERERAEKKARIAAIPVAPAGTSRTAVDDFPPGSGETKNAAALREAYKLMRMAWWMMIAIMVFATTAIVAKACERECPRCTNVESPIP